LAINPVEDLAAGHEHACRLRDILEDEFKALSALDLDAFEKLQGAKAGLLAFLTDLVREFSALNEAPAPPGKVRAAALPEWQTFQGAMELCHQLHRRNEILIRGQLEGIRRSLSILQNFDEDAANDLYDRLGRVTGGGRGRHYTDA